MVTSEHHVENIQERHGLVVADIVEGRHVGRDILVGLRNLFGGRSQSWENTLQRAQQQAIQALCEKTEDRGGNAVIGIDLEDESIARGTMMNVKAVGTAVTLTD